MDSDAFLLVRTPVPNKTSENFYESFAPNIWSINLTVVLFVRRRIALLLCAGRAYVTWFKSCFLVEGLLEVKATLHVLRI